jgi:transposase-like protein
MSKSEPDSKRRGKRWRMEQAREVIGQWRASGKSAVAFAAEHGFSATRLSYWSKQIEDVALESPKFVAIPVPAVGTTRSREALGIEIDVDGLTVRICEHVDARYVAQLVAALQTRGAERC